MTIEWRETTLGEICDEVGGIIQTGPFGSQLHESDYSPEGIPVVMPKDIIEGQIVTDSVARVASEHVERLERHKLKPGDIVYGRRGDIGRQALVREEQAGWLCGTGCLRLNLGDSVIEPLFLHYYLRQESVINGIANQAVGATLPNLNTSILRSVPVHVPPLPIQRHIAGILSSYDDLIENNLRRIKILEEMVRALYREWFVYFRFPGHENVPLVDSPLGMIPEGWNGCFGNLALIRREGINPSDFPDEEFEHFSIPAFDNGQQPAIELGEIILSGKYLIDDSCVLLSKLNPRIPRVWLPQPRSQRRAITSTEFLVLKPQARVSREFIYAKCCSEEFASQFASLAIGTSTSHQRVKPDNLFAIPTTVPALPLIEQFSFFVHPLLEFSQHLRVKAQNLRRTRDLLLPRLLSGQVALKDTVPDFSPSANGKEASPVPVVEKEPSAREVEVSEEPPPIDQIDRSEVLTVIRQIFSDGQPRDREAAIRDVAHALGYRRTGSRIQEVLHTDLLTASRRGILENVGGELRLLARSIADYDRDFLKQQFLAAIGRAWIARDEAIREFCRWMRFARTGSVIEDTARSLINGLLREGRLEADGLFFIRRVA